MSSKVELIYKLENIDAEEGLDVFEIAPVLMHFGELIRSANIVLGYEQKIDVRIKPSARGSWITEFVIIKSHFNSLLNYLKSDQGQSIMLILALLGVNVKEGIAGVIGIIRFTKGKVANYRANKDSTFTYYNDKGEKLVVSMEEHRLTQSPLIQNNYYNCTIAPMDKFPAVTAISVASTTDMQSQTITPEDKPAFDAYINTGLDKEVEESTSVLSKALIRPRRGDYSGKEKYPYSFMMGDAKLYPVTIEDETFLKQVRQGIIRLHGMDILQVDLEVRQKILRNKVTVQYAITRVLRYQKNQEDYDQIDIDDITDKD